MINFESISLEGFRSFIEPTQFNFDGSGIVHVAGQNGSGKTTLFEGIYWCLYGKVLRLSSNGVVTLPNYRTANFRGVEVILNCSVNGTPVRITRREVKGLPDLELQVNGEREANAMKTAVQRKIEEIIQMTPSVFTKVVLFGQSVSAFVELSDEQKKLALEEFFDLSWIDDALVKAKDHRAKVLSGIDSNKSRMDILQSDIDNLDSLIIEQVNFITDFWLSISKQVSAIDDNINMITYQVTKPLREVGDLQELEQLGKQAEQEQKHIYDERKRINDLILGIGSTLLKPRPKIGICSHCNQTIDAEKSNLQIKDWELHESIITNRIETKERLEIELSQLVVKDYTELLDKIQAANSAVRENQKILGHNESVEETNRRNDTFKSKLEEDKQELLSRKPSFEKLNRFKSDRRHKCRELNIVSTVVDNALSLLEKVNYWVNKGFSPHGIKSWMFDSLLQKLNDYISYYSEKLGVLVLFSMDLSKQRTKMIMECYKSDGVQMDIGDLSSGERQRLDLAIFLGMHDLISEVYTRSNLLIIDEQMAHISSESIGEAFELLRTKDVDQIYIITHTEVDSLYVKTLNFSKVKHQTIII